LVTADGQVVRADEHENSELFWGRRAIVSAYRLGRATMAALKPLAGDARYVNDVVEAGDDLVRSIHGDAKYRRLAALKQAWDPDNVFRLNQNIVPQAAG